MIDLTTLNTIYPNTTRGIAGKVPHNADFGWHLVPANRRTAYGENLPVKAGKTLTLPDYRAIRCCAYGYHACGDLISAFDYSSHPIVTLNLLWGDVNVGDGKFAARNRHTVAVWSQAERKTALRSFYPHLMTLVMNEFNSAQTMTRLDPMVKAEITIAYPLIVHAQSLMDNCISAHNYPAMYSYQRTLLTIADNMRDGVAQQGIRSAEYAIGGYIETDRANPIGASANAAWNAGVLWHKVSSQLDTDFLSVKTLVDHL